MVMSVWLSFVLFCFVLMKEVAHFPRITENGEVLFAS